jgi:hypothetical protein
VQHGVRLTGHFEAAGGGSSSSRRSRRGSCPGASGPPPAAGVPAARTRARLLTAAMVQEASQSMVAPRTQRGSWPCGTAACGCGPGSGLQCRGGCTLGVSIAAVHLTVKGHAATWFSSLWLHSGRRPADRAGSACITHCATPNSGAACAHA